MSSNQARIMIWSPPRSLSTAFTRSMSSRGDTKIFWEPYLNCYSYGPDRTDHWADDFPDLLNDKYTIDYVNSLMKEPHPNSRVLFAKCMIEAIQGNFDVVLPHYRHTFLIRHPLKMFRSYEKLTKGVIPIDFRVTFKNIYQELEKFYDHVINELGQSAPPIIDADDLLAQPEAVLSNYCELVGIPYTPKMLKWESVKNPSVLNWECIDVGAITQTKYSQGLSLSKALQSTGFGDGSKKKTNDSNQDYSDDVKECAEHALPAYERLYDLRITI
ncbi:branched-chain-amino-acid aminotransferase-like protein 2 [Lytechinus variegatus]|uniref:branched-chain-amino-acid aminotransferase-like protein 2 n=1 Tax=Lytechinus variegatus TaxID=7654 RepID=UPI001BB1F8CA|nr:branched-chain-amino-acid aminotransferase-like protein 2 [Lytechinus variegatus]